MDVLRYYYTDDESNCRTTFVKNERRTKKDVYYFTIWPFLLLKNAII